MTQHISTNDLRLIDTTPRVLDLTLAEALEFSDSRLIRKLIKRHRDELSRYGEVFTKVVETTAVGGRPGMEFWLNEQQSLLVCCFARTVRAEEARAEIIAVFMKWREGDRRQPAGAPAVAEFSAISGPLDEYTAKLTSLRECRLIHGQRAAARLWDTLGMPSVAEPAIAATAASFERHALVGRFLAECTTASHADRVQSSVLYQAFEAWCRSSGEHPLSQKGFSLAVTAAGVRRAQSNVIWFVGIRLLAGRTGLSVVPA